MAAPACDRDDFTVYTTFWTPRIHRRCFLMQRMIIRDLLMHTTYRTRGIGCLSPELMVLILSHLRVEYS